MMPMPVKEKIMPIREVFLKGCLSIPSQPKRSKSSEQKVWPNRLRAMMLVMLILPKAKFSKSVGKIMKRPPR